MSVNHVSDYKSKKSKFKFSWTVDCIYSDSEYKNIQYPRILQNQAHDYEFKFCQVTDTGIYNEKRDSIFRSTSTYITDNTIYILMMSI